MPITCYAARNPIFQPAMRIITAISNSGPVQITTSFAHQYLTGLIVRIDIPLNYGMELLNQAYGPITVTGATTFTMDFDTTTLQPFVVPPLNPGHNYTGAQVVPIGSVDLTYPALATKNVLPT